MKNDQEASTLRQMVRHQDRNGFCGMGAIGAAGHRVMRRLEQRGLARYVAHGAVEDCELARCRDGCREDHPIYAITDAGRARLEELEADQYKAPPATDVLKSPTR